VEGTVSGTVDERVIRQWTQLTQVLRSRGRRGVLPNARGLMELVSTCWSGEASPRLRAPPRHGPSGSDHSAALSGRSTR
jgi:hypothetical protein